MTQPRISAAALMDAELHVKGWRKVFNRVEGHLELVRRRDGLTIKGGDLEAFTQALKEDANLGFLRRIFE